MHNTFDLWEVVLKSTGGELNPVKKINFGIDLRLEMGKWEYTYDRKMR